MQCAARPSTGSGRAIIADLDRYQSREERVDVLLRRAFSHSAVLEIRMRAWADSNAGAARAVSDIDRRRRAYIERLLAEAGIPQPLAATRAQLLYWTYLGAALSRSRLAGDALDRMVAELSRIALAEPTGSPGTEPGRRGGRRR